MLIVAGFFLASCAATKTEQGGDVDSASASASSSSGGEITAGTQEDLIVNVGDRVFFEFDSSELTVDAQATLDAQAAWLMQYPDSNITVEGHADERGTREYNLALGDKRAFSVYSYLAQAGIDTNRMEYVSWGKERPEVIGSDETAYSQNRRGVTIVSN
jgi:peptidoglycan-associated lipoprotein